MKATVALTNLPLSEAKQVRSVLLPAPADSVGTQISGGDSKNPNLITRRWVRIYLYTLYQKAESFFDNSAFLF